MNNQQMGTVVIKRTSSFTNKFRSYTIFNNALKVGSIKNGETITLRPGLGSQVFCCKIDWLSSSPVEFELLAGQTKKLIVEFTNDTSFLKKLGIAFAFLILPGVGLFWGGLLGAGLGGGAAGFLYAQIACKPIIRIQ